MLINHICCCCQEWKESCDHWNGIEYLFRRASIRLIKHLFRTIIISSSTLLGPLEPTKERKGEPSGNSSKSISRTWTSTSSSPPELWLCCTVSDNNHYISQIYSMLVPYDPPYSPFIVLSELYRTQFQGSLLKLLLLLLILHGFSRSMTMTKL